MAYKKTGLLRFYFSGTAVGFMQNAELQFTRNLNDTTNKDSAGWDENLKGNRSCSINQSGVLEEAVELVTWNAFDSDDPLTCVFQDQESGNSVYTFEMNLDGFTLGSPDANNVATISMSGKSTGAVVRTVTA